MDTVTIPREAPLAVLYSMGLTYRHDFGLDKEPGSGPLSSGVDPIERLAILELMRKLYAEVVHQS